jgi:hypothetical protein
MGKAGAPGGSIRHDDTDWTGQQCLGGQEGMTLGLSPGQSVVMRVGGPEAPSPPSPGRLSCTRTLYPVFGLRFIIVTFSLGSTGVGVYHTHHSVPAAS